MFETTTDTDRMKTIQVVAALLAVIAIAVLGVWTLLTGRIGVRSPLHLMNMLVIAVLCFAAIFHFKQMLLRVAFILIGIQAATRALLSRTHISVGWLHIANVAGVMLELLGIIAIIVVIVKWFDLVFRGRPSSRSENPSS